MLELHFSVGLNMVLNGFGYFYCEKTWDLHFASSSGSSLLGNTFIKWSILLLCIAWTVPQLWGYVLVIHSQSYSLYFCFVYCCLLKPFHDQYLAQNKYTALWKYTFILFTPLPPQKMPCVLYLRDVEKLKAGSVSDDTILLILKFQSKTDLTWF